MNFDMKVIFLDIDGVLIKLYDKVKKTYTEFDADRVEILKRMLDEHDFKIVISSAWRHCMRNVQAAFLQA